MNQNSTVNKGTSLKRKTRRFSPSWVVRNSQKVSDHKLDLIEQIRAGVKREEWSEMIDLIESSENDLSSILPISLKTLRKKDIYRGQLSERIYEIARLYGLGYDVFDSKSDFKQWLRTPSYTLGRKSPIELLDNSFGFELVESEIMRIKYNVYS